MFLVHKKIKVWC